MKKIIRYFGNFCENVFGECTKKLKKKLTNFYVGINKLPNAKKTQCSTFTDAALIGNMKEVVVIERYELI